MHSSLKGIKQKESRQGSTFYFWTTITRCSACLNNLTESNFGNSYKKCCQRELLLQFWTLNANSTHCVHDAWNKFFFLNSNYKNVKNINQKKKIVQFFKNKRLHKTNLILCTFNIHMPNCYHTNSTSVYTQETNSKMYTKNLFNIKKTQILYSIAHVNTKCS